MKQFELPNNFDTFMDARKQSFLKVKEYKENGGRLIGYLCSYTPLEIIEAADACGVGLCGMSDETNEEAEKMLPKNLCPLIKSTYGFAYTDKCPYTYFSDLIVGETTCDGKKKMYELLNDIKETYVMQLPQGSGRLYAKDIWYEEVKLLKEKLEEMYQITITDEKLREVVKRRNRWRKAMTDLMALQGTVPPAIKGSEVQFTTVINSFSFDMNEQLEFMEKRVKEVRKAFDAGHYAVPASAKRILITGCPSAGVADKVIPVIEENGGAVVCLDNCGGEGSLDIMVDEEAEDILRAISDRYLQVSCSVMTPNDRRIQNTKHLIEKYKVDGVIEIVLQACHTYNVEAEKMRRMVMEDAQIPYMKIESDYSKADKGQIATRISAFIEML